LTRGEERRGEERRGGKDEEAGSKSLGKRVGASFEWS
jgi:hypothetical protein